MKEGGSLQNKGCEFYSELSIKLGGDKAASDWLRGHGVAGIKYLDGDSRAKDEGSYNYVVFDDSQVNIEQTYYQPLNEGVDDNTPVNVVDLTGEVKDVLSDGNTPTFKDLEDFIRKSAPASITTADNKAIMDILASNADHIAHSSRTIFNVIDPIVRQGAIKSIKDLISSAVLIESERNKKKVEITADMSHWKARKAKRQNLVEFFHRFYVPVRVGNDMYTVRLVAIERNGNITIEPKQTELYDVLIDSKEESLGRPANEDGVLTGGSEAPSNITIRQMLNNVKDIAQNPYFTQDGALGNIRLSERLGPDGFTPLPKIQITLSKDANKSTVFHEFGHWFFHDLKRRADFFAAQIRDAKLNETDYIKSSTNL